MSGADFRVAYFPHVRRQIDDLTARTAQAGIRTKFLARLRATIERLQFRPWKIGEPVHRTRFPGGVVYKAARSPFIIEFALYERERLVLILNVRPFPLAFSK
jgi:hypothetical protein